MLDTQWCPLMVTSMTGRAGTGGPVTRLPSCPASLTLRAPGANIQETQRPSPPRQQGGRAQQGWQDGLVGGHR